MAARVSRERAYGLPAAGRIDANAIGNEGRARRDIIHRLDVITSVNFRNLIISMAELSGSEPGVRAGRLRECAMVWVPIVRRVPEAWGKGDGAGPAA